MDLGKSSCAVRKNNTYAPLGFRLENASNQTIQKNNDGTLSGYHYVVRSEPSSLRPVKAWTITVEEWECTHSNTAISSNDILFLRITNSFKPFEDINANHIRDMKILGKRCANLDNQGFNALMEAFLMMTKIDAGRAPDIEKILNLYHLA